MESKERSKQGVREMKEDEDVALPGAKMSKKEKGRYKKLRKRLETVLTHQKVSGFVDDDDCKEWTALSLQLNAANSTGNNPPAAVPQFRWRKGSPEGRRTEGSHHRDILFSLMLPESVLLQDGQSSDGNGASQSGGGKKRSRQDSSNDGALRYKGLPTWLCLHNPSSISSCGVVEVHVANTQLMSLLKRKIVEEVSSSGRSVLVTPTRWFSGNQAKGVTDALLFASPPKSNSKSKEKQTTKKTNLEDLVIEMKSMVLSRDELVKANYPVTNVDGEEMVKDATGWVSSQEQPESRKSVEPSCKIWALDCEMVETTEGRALARFTLLEAIRYDTEREVVEEQVVLDTLVKPDHRVTDYLTIYSGVTAALLEQGPCMTVHQIQNFIAAKVGANDILVGHSLENDLQVCRWFHPTCVDTAIVFSHKNRSFKYSLRHLSRILLKRSIQEPNKPHCSEEDAKAALDLAVSRAIKGPGFGPKDMRSSNQWLALSQNDDSDNNSVVAVGPNAWLQRYITNPPNAAHALSCDSCTDTNTRALTSFLSCSNKRKPRLVWAQVHASNEKEVDTCENILKQLISTISTTDTALLIALQCQYDHVVGELKRRRTLQDPKTTMSWTNEEEERLKSSIDESQLGVAIWVGGKKTVQ